MRNCRLGLKTIAIVLLGLFALVWPVRAQLIPLGGAEDVAVLGATTVTNTGPTVISGNVALTPGTAITGFPPGTVVGGTIHANDAIAIQAHAGALAAYNQLANESFTSNLTGINLGGLTLSPGTYRFDTFAQLSGMLKLDTGGDPNAAFHFQIGTTLTADSASSITLLNGNSVNIFWQVGSSATLGAGSAFVGTIIADQSITLNTGASLAGRALALNGAVTLDTNLITVPTPTPSPTPTATPIPTATPSPTATPGPTASPSPTATPGPTASPSPTATPGPSPSPTATPGPTASPTATPGPTATPSPGVTPTPSPGGGPTPVPTPLTPNQREVLKTLRDLAMDHPNNPLILLLETLPSDLLPGALILLSPDDLTAIFNTGLGVPRVQLNNIEHRLFDVRQGVSGFNDSSFTVNDTRSTPPIDAKDMGSIDSKDMGSVEGKESASSASSAAPDQRWGFFISGSGEIVDVESTSIARGSTFTTGGVTLGLDYRLTSHFVLGVAVGYANTSADLSLGGNLDGNSGRVSLYGTYYSGGFYLNGIVGAGYGSIDTRRLTVGGFAHGDTTTTDVSALLGTGYDWHFGKWSFGPLASLRFGTAGIDDFTERGPLGSLSYDSQSQDSLMSAIGLQLFYTTKVGRIILTPMVRAQWEHEYLTSTSSIDAEFTSGNLFTVQGPHIGRDGLLLDLGVAAQLTPRVGVYTFYTGELGRENYNSHSITAGVRVSF